MIDKHRLQSMEWTELIQEVINAWNDEFCEESRWREAIATEIRRRTTNEQTNGNNALTVLRIMQVNKPFTLHIEINSTLPISFDFNWEGLDYYTALQNLCKIAPHILSLYAAIIDRQEDGITKPTITDMRAVRSFLTMYAERVPSELAVMMNIVTPETPDPESWEGYNEER